MILTMKNTKKYYRNALIGIVGLSLAGCTTSSEPSEVSSRDPEIALERLDISLDADANLDSATSVDLVMVYKADLLKALMKMSAADYYASAEQIRRDYPDMVDVWHWELTPGQIVKDYPITLKDKDPVGGVIFADYLTPGDHRIRLSSVEHAHLRLKRYEFCILEQGCAPNLMRESVREQYPKNQYQTDAISGHLQSAEPQNRPASTDPKGEIRDAKDTISSAKSLAKELAHF